VPVALASVAEPLSSELADGLIEQGSSDLRRHPGARGFVHRRLGTLRALEDDPPLAQHEPLARLATSMTSHPQSSKPSSTLGNGPTNPWSKSNSLSLYQNQGDSNRISLNRLKGIAKTGAVN
jgi:hypothetical protein